MKTIDDYVKKINEQIDKSEISLNEIVEIITIDNLYKIDKIKSNLMKDPQVRIEEGIKETYMYKSNISPEAMKDIQNYYNMKAGLRKYIESNIEKLKKVNLDVLSKLARKYADTISSHEDYKYYDKRIIELDSQLMLSEMINYFKKYMG